MGLSVNSIQIETVTPEKAAEFLKANYSRNRRVRQSWVEYLAREMREGRFMSTAEIHIMYRNGEPTMINGQHTCLAIIKYGKPTRVTVRKTTTNEAGQIAMAYAFGHDTGIHRTFMDGMNAYGLSEETGLPSEHIDRMIQAIRYMKGNFSASKASGGTTIRDSPSDLVPYVLRFAPTMRLFNLHTTPCDHTFMRRLRRRSSLSVALVTFYYQPEKAIHFWSQIARPDELPWNDARVTTRKYIEMPYPTKMEEGKLSRKIARCWRAFLDGKPLEMVGALVGDAPISIAGTPYTGKQDKVFIPEVDGLEFSWYASDSVPA